MLLFSCSALHARIFFVGSNPYLSIMAFPQDVLKYQGNFVYYYPTYQKLPWWGDIDQQSNIPPFGKYNTVEEKYSKEWTNPTTGKLETRYYNHESSYRTFKNEIGFSNKFSDSLVNTTSINYSTIIMKDMMTGLLTNTIDPERNAFPVDYNLEHVAHNFNFSSILGFTLWRNPCGVKFAFGVNQGGDIDQDYRIKIQDFKKNGEKADSVIINSRKMMWGWSQEECSIIFGFPTEADGHSEYEYALGPIYRGDLQLGITLPRVKLGTRFRYIKADQDQFAWRIDSLSLANATDLLDSAVARNFSGDYYEHPLNRKADNVTYRLYGNIFWKKREHYSLNTLLFFGFDSQKSKNVIKIHDIFDHRKFDIADETSKSFIFELNPNINILPGKKFSYVDAALLIEGCHTIAETENRPEITDTAEHDYNNSSDAVENFADVGIDISTMFPIFGNAKTYVGLGMIVFANSKFSWATKNYQYGTTQDTSVYIYHLNKERVEKREFWFNSMFILQWGIGNFQIRAELTEPLLYSLKKAQNLTYYKREAAESYYTKRNNENFNLWASQDQVTVGLFIAYNFKNLFRGR